MGRAFWVIMIFISWKREKREKKNETDKNHRPRPTLQFNSIKITLVASFYIGPGVVVLLSLILLTHSHEISGFPGDMADVKSWCKGLFVYPFVTGTLCTKTRGRKKTKHQRPTRCDAMRCDTINEGLNSEWMAKYTKWVSVTHFEYRVVCVD